MIRLLVLGGTGDALALAQRLHACCYEVIYSVAGLVRIPELPCRVISGGFSGENGNNCDGLACFLRDESIQLLIDATHPYAARISAKAVAAANEYGIPCWRLERPPWQPQTGDHWRTVATWPEIITALQLFQRPFFTIGRLPLAQSNDRLPHQHWTIRTALPAAQELPPEVTVIRDIGPFSFEQELTLLRELHCDVLISKNSGGHAVSAKLAAARRLNLPIIMLERPALPTPTRCFSDPIELVEAISTIMHHRGLP